MPDPVCPLPANPASRIRLRNPFERKTVPIAFTAVGHCLLELADKIFPAIEETERNLMRLKDGTAGTLRIVVECHTCFDWLSRRWMFSGHTGRKWNSTLFQAFTATRSVSSINDRQIWLSSAIPSLNPEHYLFAPVRIRYRRPSLEQPSPEQGILSDPASFQRTDTDHLSRRGRHARHHATGTDTGQKYRPNGAPPN